MEKSCSNCGVKLSLTCARCFGYREWEPYPILKDSVVAELTGEDPVNSPSHYDVFPSVTAIDIIKATLSDEEYKGFLKGNFLKYRLRAGYKDDVTQDLDKSQVYRDWLFDLEN